MNISRFLPCLLFILICQYLPVAGQSPDFITTWKTDNPGTSNSTSIAIPTRGGYIYSYDVDWENDGVWDDIGVTGGITHDYGVAGTYTVAIRGDFPAIYFYNTADKEKIISIDNWGTINWQTFQYAFNGCSNLIITAPDSPDLSSVTDMTWMFNQNSSLTGDFSNWDVSNVIEMGGMFYGCQVFNSDVSAWDVSNVTTMHSMFSACDVFNSDVSAWNVSNVTTMAFMFSGATVFNSDLSLWDVSNVTYMPFMFKRADNFNADLSLWDVSSVTDMGGMFLKASVFNADLSLWDVSSVTNMAWMFNRADNFNADLSLWDVSSVTDMYLMFWRAYNFNADLSLWNVSSVTNMSGMFSEAYVFNADLSLWNVSSVTNMGGMFWEAYVFNADLSLWDVSSVTDMGLMFSKAYNFNADLSLWDVSSVTDMGGMFSEASVFNADLSLWDVSSVTYMPYMFYRADNFNADLSLWDVSSVTDMTFMFSGATVFNSDLSLWDVSNVTNMPGMFINATSFNADLSLWDMSSATNMLNMFYGASSFNTNLGNWNIQSVEFIDEIFSLSGMSQCNYDQTLMGWASQNPLPNMTMGAIGITYCVGDQARDSLINVYDWSITGDSLNCSPPQIDFISACDSFLWVDGNTYYSSNNTAIQLLTSSEGCDSFITLNLTIISSNSGTDIQTACDSYTWIDGNTYSSSNNTASHTLVNAQGCDSVVTLDLTITNSNTSTDIQTACGSYIWMDGNTYSITNNTATHTLVNAQGCDSVVTLDLTITSSNTGTDIQTACDTYTWIDGNTYTSSNNTATHTLVNAQGCDSVVTLDLTITSSNTGTDIQTACDTYTWIDGNTYTSSNNTATHTIPNAVGCDSVITLDLTITNSSGSTDVLNACDEFTWTDGNTYTSSNNTATHIIPNAVGCDSVITLDLTITNSSASTDIQSGCERFTWMDGNTYTSSNNIATHTIPNAVGCDSVITLDLTITNSSGSTDVLNACDEFTWTDGNTYTSSNNTATHIIPNAVGCDSVITLDLTITNSSASTDIQSGCERFTWMDGNTYTSSNNIATHIIPNAVGCDSVITLDLTMTNSSASTDVQSGCETFTWMDGNTYTSSNNIATHTIPNAVGCDSVITLDLTINTQTTGTDMQIACDEFTWIDGNTYTGNNNDATFTLVNTQGCDSVVTLDLTIESVNSSLTQVGDTLIADLAGATYQWLDCNNSNSPIAGETSQSFSTTSPGNYAVEVSTINCNAVSDCYFITGVGVQSVFEPGAINVYPNPSRGQADISFPEVVENLKINLLDLKGRVIEQFQYAGAKEEVSLHMTDVPNGVYFLQMTFEGGSHQAKLIVIR